ncbi:MAG: 7TM domain-containing protein [Candidatus Andersenbacteria bacterium]
MKLRSFTLATLLLLLTFTLSVGLPLTVLAQAAQPTTPTPTPELKANAGPDREGLVDQELDFDAVLENLPEGTKATFAWSFGDQTGQAQGDRVRHTYHDIGRYKVTLTATTPTATVSDSAVVTIYERSLIVITDTATDANQESELKRQADRSDTQLIILADRAGSTDFVRQDNLSRMLLDRAADLRRADALIDWTTGDTGLNALTKFAQQVPNLQDLRLSDKPIISLAAPFSVISRIAQSTFDILKPKYILLTSSTALDAVIEAASSDQILNRVQQTGNEYRLIGTFSERAISDLTPLNLMSFLVNFMINKGVPVNTIVLILMLPIIATIFAFARQIVGLRAFGIYIPTIVTLSFLALGLTYGLTVFFVVLAVGTLFRVLLRRIRLAYVPRLAIVLTTIAFAILGLLAVGAYTNQTTFVALAIFPILIMVALAEQFVSAQIEQGFSAAVLLTVETLVLSIATYYLVSWDPFQSLILAYPELILLTFIINILLGRWTGLRLMEYYRFRQVRRFAKLP